jgi:RimJ/RimL family protein N-acetyltransferase
MEPADPRSTSYTRLNMARLHAVPVRALTKSDRALLLEHLLDLGPDDRYLRFGNPLSDQIIRQYVASINFDSDLVLGVYNDGLTLDAAGHFAPLPEKEDATAPKSAEFGLSVAANARGRGLGTALFVRAATHARNSGINLLYMHCLTQNQAMMRIARRAGMHISASFGEANAHLTLPPADSASRVAEAMHQQIGLFDYALKKQLSSWRTLWPHSVTQPE